MKHYKNYSNITVIFLKCVIICNKFLILTVKKTYFKHQSKTNYTFLNEMFDVVIDSIRVFFLFLITFTFFGAHYSSQVCFYYVFVFGQKSKNAK